MDYYNIEFYTWLDSLVINPSESEARVGNKLLSGFQEMFPVDKIPNISLEQYYSKSGKYETFCSWITTRTKLLSGGLFPLKNMGYGLRDDQVSVNWINRNNLYGSALSCESILQDEILRPLYLPIEEEIKLKINKLITSVTVSPHGDNRLLHSIVDFTKNRESLTFKVHDSKSPYYRR